MSKKQNSYAIRVVALVLITLSVGFFVGFKVDRHNFEVTKNLDIFNSLYKELDLFYVDTISVEKTVNAGIKAMLASLDPYTNYFPESEQEQFAMMTTGEYGGVGAIIMQRDSSVCISELYEGMPAQLAGLKPGDKLIRIDDIDLKGKTSSQVSELLKGQANTKFTLMVEREGETAPMSKEITRMKIALPAVTYFGSLRDSVGYIFLSSFTEKSAKEVKLALLELKKDPKVTSLILDLRNNPGGIMEEAIEIVNFFVPKGKVVLTTKGRLKQWDKIYKTTQEPIDVKMPLAVLINGESASASEIVAGALQDMDRAVIVGDRSYGKGLVQTTRNLPYNGTLKVTIAKYYIPSGRLIQAIDYGQKNADGSAGRIIPDSLTTEFKTANGRLVRDGGGVKPDFVVKHERRANISYYLFMDNIIFDYATRYQKQHAILPLVNDFSLSDADYEAFKALVKARDFKYDKQSEKMLSNLKEVAKFEGYLDNASEEFKALEAKLTHNLDRDLDFFKPEIKDLIQIELARRYYYQKGEIMESLKTDEDVKQAIAVLRNPVLYEKTLNSRIN